MKDLRAVRIGLQLTYLSVLLNLAIMNIPGVLFLVLVILQSRRVLRNGKLLQNAGWLPDGRN